MHTRMWSKVGYMGIKLDMSKAYDRVEWVFLESVMHKMGFPVRWVKLIMECVRSVTYAIIVNGQPVGHIVPERGLRQGDPLSPYLFLICAEALSSMLSRAEENGVITGVPTSKNGPRLSHLFFADDSLLFCKANSVEWRRLTKILDKYEAASGQKLNKDKTSLFFSRNTSDAKKEEITRMSGLQAIDKYEKYLGLPTLVGKSRSKAFQSIKDRVWNRLQNWKVNFLSQAGKEILLKAVIQAIPTYCMSVFLLPVSLCKAINRLMQRFWWGHKENFSKIHWMSWERMSTAKEKGGLGFRDLVLFNKALLAKQFWRLLQNPNSLVARIFKAKYYPTMRILDAQVGKRPSLAWRSIISAKDIIKQGAIWRVGDGKDIRVCGDCWLPRPTTFAVQSAPTTLADNSMVHVLIDAATGRWKIDLISENFSEEEATVIQNIPLSPLLPRDKLIWRCTANGQFSVRSAYHLAVDWQAEARGGPSNQVRGRETWKVCWKLNVPNTVKMFVWRACHNLLPTKANLCKRKVIDSPLCPICSLEEESAEHIIWSCPSASDVWSCGPIKLQKSKCGFGNFLQLFEDLIVRYELHEMELFAVVARSIWMRRNNVVHGGLFTSPKQLFAKAAADLENFQRAREQPEGSEITVLNPQVCRWQPPPGGTLKVNWDAALDRGNCCVGLGFLARDADGRFLKACGIKMRIAVEPTTAEALAALHAVRSTMEMGYSKVIFEGDALVIVNAINSKEACESSYGHFVEDVKRLQGGFILSSFVHVFREANSAAHQLAKQACTHVTDKHWWHCIPSCIDGIVRKEETPLLLS